jgi:hypothetical protein
MKHRPVGALASLILIAIVAAACRGGGNAATSPTPTPFTGGLSRGLIAFAADRGIGVLDPASGKSAIVAPFPAGGAFRASGPVWGTAAGVGHPVIYFTVHDDRPAESRDSSGVVPYDWLFRVDPFTGASEPVAASWDAQSEGPIGLVGNGHYIAMTVGCCANYEVDVLDLNQPLAGLKVLAKPADPVTFFTEGIAPSASGLVAVRAFGTGAWYWLNADEGALNPFPLKLGSDDGPIAISPDGSLAAIALPDRGAVIEAISVAVPVASPAPTPGVTPIAAATPSARPSPTAPAAPRPVNSHLPHPDGMAWSPDGKQLIFAVSSELQMYSATAPDGTAPQGRFLIAGGVTGVAWSAAINDQTMAGVKAGSGPQSSVDAWLAATKLPAAADTPQNRPLTQIYLWRFDSSKPSPISSITDAAPGVLAKYPPLRAGVVIHHWAPSDTWQLLGGCVRYRVVVTGSIPPVAATVGITGGPSCSTATPTPTPTVKVTPKPT